MSVHMYHSKSEKLVCSLQHLKCLRKIVLVQMEDPIRVQLFNGTLLNELYQIISDPPPTLIHVSTTLILYLSLIPASRMILCT